VKWGVVGKGNIPHVVEAARRVVAILDRLEQDYSIQDGLAEAMQKKGMAMVELNEIVDIWVTVGGDGTLLYCQHFTEKPVLGVNAGAVGFLTEVELEDVAGAMEAVVAGKHTIEERHRISCKIDGVPVSDAVNEVTLQTRRIAKLIRFRITVNGQELDVFRADGVIVSTATGSTGYAMSVGGPLVHPKVPGVVIAPIAPFKLASRPWVIADDSHIEVTLMERDSAQGVQQAFCVIDGIERHGVATNATVTIGPSDRPARYIRLGTNFYERVREKLSR
jgi:NAD+ kinase